MLELVLPWPDRGLHPNARTHWASKAKLTASAKQEAWALAINDGWNLHSLQVGPIHVWIDGYPTDRRRRDADGLLSSLKAALDGIALAMNVDDRRFVPHPWVKDTVVKGGEVRIRITSGPDGSVGLG